MIDLLEHLLEVSAYKVVGYTDGWIIPSGKFVEITEKDHERDAYKILKNKGYSEEFLKKKKKKDDLLDFFYSKTRYIRCMTGPKETNVSVPDIKITRRQISTIRKFAQTYENFYYTIIVVVNGWSFSEFMKDVRKYLEVEG